MSIGKFLLTQWALYSCWNKRFGAFARRFCGFSFDYSNISEKGWSEDNSDKPRLEKEDNHVSLYYHFTWCDQNEGELLLLEEVTTYITVMILTYKVMLLETCFSMCPINDPGG